MDTVISQERRSSNETDPSRSVWRVVGESVSGTSHLKANLPCQDAHAARTIGTDWVALAVADGAGSAPRADVGAKTAANCAVERLAQRVGDLLAQNALPADESGWRSIMEDVVRASLRAVSREAETRGEPVSHFATTLLVVLTGPTVTVGIQIGDGGTVVLADDGVPAALTSPPKGEYVNEATFLTSQDALNASQFAFRGGPVKGVATLTDGLQLLAYEYPSWAPHLPFFRNLFDYFETETDCAAASQTLAGFLCSPRVRERTDDDLTLVVVTRARAGEPPAKETNS